MIAVVVGGSSGRKYLLKGQLWPESGNELTTFNSPRPLLVAISSGWYSPSDLRWVIYRPVESRRFRTETIVSPI